MLNCLTGARFNMKADILRQGYVSSGTVVESDTQGEWVNQQDPDSGEIIRIWQPNDNPATSQDESLGVLEPFSCIARGIIDGGIRVSGSTERFGEEYDNIDYVKITFPADVRISKRDRITNIRDASGRVIWKEEEVIGSPPTVYSVGGVTPILDPFGRHIESFALLERAERQ